MPTMLKWGETPEANAAFVENYAQRIAPQLFLNHFMRDLRGMNFRGLTVTPTEHGADVSLVAVSQGDFLWKSPAPASPFTMGVEIHLFHHDNDIIEPKKGDPRDRMFRLESSVTFLRNTPEDSDEGPRPIAQLAAAVHGSYYMQARYDSEQVPFVEALVKLQQATANFIRDSLKLVPIDYERKSTQFPAFTHPFHESVEEYADAVARKVV